MLTTAATSKRRRLDRVWASLLAAPLALVLACSTSEEPRTEGADLGAWGERVERRSEHVAFERFLLDARARDRFASVYPAMHHDASAESFLAGLEAEAALAPLARDLRTVVETELQAEDDAARAMRERWDDPQTQGAVARRIASAVLRGLETANRSATEAG